MAFNTGVYRKISSSCEGTKHFLSIVIAWHCSRLNYTDSCGVSKKLELY